MEASRTPAGTTRSPAQLYALIFGAVLTVAGILGFFYNSEFTSDKSVRDAVLGILDVNGWHNVVHIATGALGIVAARSLTGARTYCLAFGIVYLLVCVWGFVAGNDGSILSIVPVNTADNFLHLLLAAGGFAAYAASAPATHAHRPSPAVS
jgi:NAD/NADP transhydrogenase beta subunit